MAELQLSCEQAYSVMYGFLAGEYERSGSSEIGVLLGSLSTGSNGLPMDRALWDEWLDAINAVVGCDLGRAPLVMTMEESFGAMVGLVEHWFAGTRDPDVLAFFERLRIARLAPNSGGGYCQQWARLVCEVLAGRGTDTAIHLT